jgi:hypothetical protein
VPIRQPNDEPPSDDQASAVAGTDPDPHCGMEIISFIIIQPQLTIRSGILDT